jgi:superfamily II DNA/RNA helicase
LEYQKLQILIDFANRLSLNQAIIFTNHRGTALRVRDELMDRGFISTGLVTSDSDAETREKILCQFRLGQIKYLISTDLISRGIDIDDLRCVINFDFPKSSESYIHRIGRSGRYGGQGVAINIITYDDSYLLTQIKNEYGIDIDDLPTIDEVNRILTNFDPPSGKASSSQNYL